jgi:pimeloyl-ACP methyl ester carboxylesterase
MKIGSIMDIYLKETGSENSETIVFVHGGAMAGWMWDEQVKALTDYHCIVPDLPEHGQSSDVKPFSINDSAEMIVDIIQDFTNNRKAHLVGISLGAQIIVKILSTNSELVDHAIISGTLARTIPHTEVLLKLLNYAIKAYKPVKNTEFFIRANMRTYNAPKNLFDKFKESTLLVKNDALERILKENMFFRLPEGLEKVEAPVLVMTGEKDYKIIKESANDLLKSIPLSQGYMAPKVGHAWNLENPKLFNWVLRNWINNKPVKDALLPIKY